MLLGRRSECERLDELLDGVRAGQSRALVVRGEPGVGRTALLDYLVERASGCRVARASGVQTERGLSLSGLHQLCAPMLDRLDLLPGPLRDALATAFGLSAGDPPARLPVSMAALSLLCEVAEEQPLVCAIDDAQWLDRASAQALAFVTRRLSAASVAVILAVREPSDVPEFAALPELVVEGLADGDARALLDSVVPGPLDDRVRDRIVAETRGNPRALLELPRGSAPAELAGGFGIPDATPLSGRIEESFRRRLAPLPAETQRLLLVAAAEPVGEPVLVWRAAARLDIAHQDAAPAAAAGLVEFGDSVRFRHPLVRSAVYRAASLEERQSVHRALAEATDPEADPDRRAWHRAQATPGPDEDVADELERSAGRAQAHAGLAAGATFMELAAGLTPDPARRAERALAAAQVKHQAGESDAALELLATAEAGPLDALQRAHVDLVRARIAFTLNRGTDSPSLLLEAAKRIEPHDVGLARETYLGALSAAMLGGRLAGGTSALEVAKAAAAAPRSSQSPRAADLLLDGQARVITDGFTAGAPMLKRALSAFRSADISSQEELSWLWRACGIAADLWDDETWEVLSTRHVELARDAGALSVLPMALGSRAGVHLLAGEFAAAASQIEEMEAVMRATGSDLAPHVRVALLAWQGREAEASELIEATLRQVVTRGDRLGVTIVQGAAALLYNGLGRYEDALAAVEQAAEYPELGGTNAAVIELIEAAARSGKAGLAADALERLSETTRTSGTEWALGTEAASRALLSDGQVAEDLYREAIERLGRSRAGVYLARAHLLYGEWLRRQRRRVDAREELRTAREMFTTMGIEGFAQRAERELLATGETARKRTAETRDHLTPQETQIAQLARDGHSNPQIGSQLFISPRTVEYHLHKVFGKLNINSRNQLDRVLSGGPDALQAA